MCQNSALCGNGLIATFQLSSAASLNLGRSQNGVLGNELISLLRFIPYFYFPPPPPPARVAQ